MNLEYGESEGGGEMHVIWRAGRRYVQQVLYVKYNPRIKLVTEGRRGRQRKRQLEKGQRSDTYVDDIS